GIALYLVSNNHHERVSTFAAELDVPIYPFAKKPLKGTYRRILADSKVPANQIAALGDQLLTDVLGANRMGMLAMLTKPIAQKDLKVTKINRVLENLVFARLARKKKLIKGEYYD
ncbi:MAG: YqeG family HAD IIIA-type phosphatase, partial [Erysipelotrichaceae bacterium]